MKSNSTDPKTNTPGSKRQGFRAVTTRNLIIICAVVLLSTTFAISSLHFVPGAQLMENWLSDFRVTLLTKPQPIDPRIVITSITEDTLATMPYRSPVDRGFLIKLLTRLKSAQVRAVAIDILFDQPTEPKKDLALKRLIADFPVPVIIASTQSQASLTKDQQAYLAAFSKGLITGDVNLIKDVSDGTVRRIYVERAGANPQHLGFVTAILAALGKPIPDKDLALVYRAPPKAGAVAFKTFPAHTSLILPKSWFKDKIVLIGADLPLSDRHKTVFAAVRGTRAGTLPGVRVHAHALSQLLDERRAPVFSMPQTWGFVLVLATLGILITLFDTSIIIKAISVIASFIALWACIILAYRNFHLPLPFLAPNIALITSFGLGIAYLGHQDRLQKKFIQSTFSKYLSPVIVNMLIANPSELKAGGERRELTYLFTDLADFTSLTEQSDPAEMVDLLNEYIDGMCTIVIRHDGTIDKIVGDAIIAFFGAPIVQEDHCARAVECALEMDAFAQAFATKQKARGMPLGVTRIGVHSGEATIGNFGGQNFFDYTAFGDTVNTAARLESINKHLGTRICISTETAQKCPGLRSRPIGNLILKGKTKGIKTVEPLDFNEKTPYIDVEDYLVAYKAMEQNDKNALDAFQQIVDSRPDDTLAAFHLNRLKRGETGTIIDLGVK